MVLRLGAISLGRPRIGPAEVVLVGCEMSALMSVVRLQSFVRVCSGGLSGQWVSCCVVYC